MIVRFCTYTVLRNLRPFEPFFVLFFLLGMGLDYAHAAFYLAFQQIVWASLEVPGGAVTDRWGRRRALIASFIANGVAFAMLGLAAAGWSNWLLLLAALSLYGLGESLRSGTHKAMMLHWAELHGRSDHVDEIIALTRLFSKTSAGVAALVGGMLIWLTGSFALLFWFSAGVCVLGGLLIATYPKVLEGPWADRAAPAAEPQTATEQPAHPRWRDRFWRLFAAPGIVPLLIASVIFESQIKVAKSYLQPYLAEGFRLQDIAVIGGLGGLAIGVYFLVQDVFAGFCATQGKRVKKRVQGVLPAATWIYAAGTIAIVVVAAMLWMQWRWAGLPALLLLVGLQNLRRPLFIAALDKFMDKYQRATTISVETLARCVAYAITVVVSGYLADAVGLRSAYAAMAGLFVLGLWPTLLAARRESAKKRSGPRMNADEHG